jgi:integrase
MIKKNRFGIWVISEYINGIRVRESLHTRSKLAAIAEAERIRKARGGGTIAGRLRVSDFAASYLADLETRSSPQYHREARTVIDAFSEQYGRRYLDTITPVDCSAWIQGRRSGPRKATRSPESVNADLRMIRAAFRFAVLTLRAIPFSPWATVPRFVSDERPPRVLSISEFRAVLSAARAYDPDVADLIEVLVYTGMRRSEALRSLTWEAVDFDRGVITLTGTKGRRDHRRKFRLIPITPRVRAILEARRRDPWPFMHRDRHPWKRKAARVRIDPGHITHLFPRLARSAGVPNVSLHDLRRTAATWIASHGLPSPLLIGLLGHSDPGVTQRHYIGADLESTARVIARVESEVTAIA